MSIHWPPDTPPSSTQRKFSGLFTEGNENEKFEDLETFRKGIL